MASKEQQSEEDDRLGSLPDSLLLHVLSFLDTRQAVLTSILSSRWKDLWTFTPSLDFHSSKRNRNRNRGYDESNFIRFVYRSLLSHAAPKIHRFGLSLTYLHKHSSDVDAWIRSAVRKGVEELDVEMLDMGRRISFPDYYELPCWLFKCQTLTSLKLSNCRFPHVKFSIFFSSIIKLSLSKISFNSEELQDFLAGCPLLEDLVIVDCRMSVLCISSSSNPRLRHLKVEESDINRVEVDAPHLQILKYSGRLYARCSFKELSSLREARLDLCPSYNSRFDLSFLRLSVQNLRHAKLLKLSRSCIQAMHTPTFTDLDSCIFKTKCLVLETGLDEVELPGIASLLWSSSDLETLVINLLPRQYIVFGSLDKVSLTRKYDFDGKEYWESLTVPFPCLVHRLKNIKITNLFGQECDSFSDISNEMNLVRFLLRNAMVLEKIAIHASSEPRSAGGDEWKRFVLKVTQELVAIPRASSLVDAVFLHE